MTRATSRLVISSLVVGFLCSAACADEFDVIKSYRFIPRVSDVTQNGGIAGRQETFSVWGTFDLNLGPEVSIPELEIHPAFENVQSWLNPDSPLTYVLITDQVFNLSGLKGNYVRPNRIKFQGETTDGASVDLVATMVGPLLHLRGATHPPCCDFFGYEIDAYAHVRPFADFNFDGTVNTADYTAWRNNLGLASGATLEQGDADGDGDVDHADYTVWKRDVGTVIDMAGFANAEGSTVAGVPEPASLSLLAGSVLFFGFPARFHRRAA